MEFAGAGDMVRGVGLLEAKGVLPVFAVGVLGRWVLGFGERLLRWREGERVGESAALAMLGVWVVVVGAKVKEGPR